jgi:2-polyprenyl-6-hydroxyphenyl methylase/3-demethylubiquinone-9 3-methyltransferase
MSSYYTEKLSAERLRRCYDLAPLAVKHYLAAEIEHVSARIASSRRVLELGCGYGRVLRQLSRRSTMFVGIDTAFQNLAMARTYIKGAGNVALLLMDALRLGFPAGVFDLVCCVQNGISAFHVDQRELMIEAVRVVKPGGRVLFSSYAENFWEDRLNWFRIQAAHGLVGEIDEAATGAGRIVTKDGFTATTVTPEQLLNLSRGLGSGRSVQVVADSSVFCEIQV